MTMPLNRFQTETREKIQELLSRKSLAAKFEIAGGPDEYAVKINIGEYESWIYPDGAGVLAPNMDERFEIYDYDSLDQLQERYLDFMHKLLDRIDRDT